MLYLSHILFSCGNEFLFRIFFSGVMQSPWWNSVAVVDLHPLVWCNLKLSDLYATLFHLRFDTLPTTLCWVVSNVSLIGTIFPDEFILSAVIFFFLSCPFFSDPTLVVGGTMINCSQTNFVAIILVLSVFFMRFFAWPIFRLTLLTFRPQKRDKQVAPSGH